MNLWLCISEEQYERLERDKTLFGLWDDNTDVTGKEWLSKQMINHGLERSTSKGDPIICWHKFQGKVQRPDLRRSEFRQFRVPSVCIELDVLSERVLLLDAIGWGYISENTYCPDPKCTDVPGIFKWYSSLGFVTQIGTKYNSWENVFKIDGCEFLRAAIWSISAEDVVSVTKLKSLRRTPDMKNYKYVLIDGYNSDVVVRTDNMTDVKKAARTYDEGCEGDWLALLFKITKGEKSLVEDWSF